MNRVTPQLIAVDVGNSRIKLGMFAEMPASASTQPIASLEIDAHDWAPNELLSWLGHTPGVAWRIASVNPRVCQHLVDCLQTNSPPGVNLQVLTNADFPIQIAVKRHDLVGQDRLAAAVAANSLRPSGASAIIIDLGTAITADALSAQGEFLGGAILPGIGMSARALCEFTAQLPKIDMTELNAAPSPLGIDTEMAMRAGLFWGAVGAMRELIDQYTTLTGATPWVVLTGGTAPSVASLLGESVMWLPHLTLSGIALTNPRISHT